MTAALYIKHEDVVKRHCLTKHLIRGKTYATFTMEYFLVQNVVDDSEAADLRGLHIFHSIEFTLNGPKILHD